MAKGETAYGIARRYGIDLKALVRANALEAPERLYPGTGLWIPSSDWDGQALGPAPSPPDLDGAEKFEPPPGAGPPPDPMPRIAVRRARSCRDAAPQVEPPEAVSSTGFSWPLNGVVISRFGGAERARRRGIHIAAPRGTPVRAAADGDVLFTGERPGFGKLVILQHRDRRKTFYGQNAANCVALGQRIARGTVIGLVGDGGSRGTPYLYFEVRVGERSVSPRRYLPSDP